MEVQTLANLSFLLIGVVFAVISIAGSYYFATDK